MPHLAIDTLDHVHTITLTRPDKRNALNAEVVSDLHRAFRDAAADDDVRVVVLTGEGPAFCAGADLEYLMTISSNTPLENAMDSSALMAMLHAVRTCPKPVIAKVHGPALAGGCGLALACDIVVADEVARFGFTEVRIGFVPAVVMRLVIERVGMGNARELLLRGNVIDADTAQQMGMINYVVGEEELGEMTFRLATEIAMSTAPEAVRLTKQLFLEIEPLSLDEAMRHASVFNALARTSGDFRTGVTSFLNKTKPQW